jgi:hypothetical protein
LNIFVKVVAILRIPCPFLKMLVPVHKCVISRIPAAENAGLRVRAKKDTEGWTVFKYRRFKFLDRGWNIGRLIINGNGLKAT